MKMKMNDRLACGSKFSCGMYFPLVLNMICGLTATGPIKCEVAFY